VDLPMTNREEALVGEPEVERPGAALQAATGEAAEAVEEEEGVTHGV